ncbi:MAG: twin-arginine translocase TatA/TatE family subunit [Synergistaceae bacterium]|jgi:sec-independent protein translocase protein TatA|nr:twin-arginine translocase TatA/TatE family subunit [Synergistaceae bacterium]
MNLGMGEIALWIVLALVLFGAKRLPEVGRAAGSAIREFKSALNGAELNGTGRKGTEPKEAEPRRGGSGDGENP